MQLVSIHIVSILISGEITYIMEQHPELRKRAATGGANIGAPHTNIHVAMAISFITDIVTYLRAFAAIAAAYIAQTAAAFAVGVIISVSNIGTMSRGDLVKRAALAAATAWAYVLMANAMMRRMTFSIAVNIANMRRRGSFWFIAARVPYTLSVLAPAIRYKSNIICIRRAFVKRGEDSVHSADVTGCVEMCLAVQCAAAIGEFDLIDLKRHISSVLGDLSKSAELTIEYETCGVAGQKSIVFDLEKEYCKTTKESLCFGEFAL